MAHSNNFREKREVQHNTHNRRAGVAKFKRNLGHRKHRRWDNRIHKQWVEERASELGQPRGSTRDSRNNIRQRIKSEMPTP